MRFAILFTVMATATTVAATLLTPHNQGSYSATVTVKTATIPKSNEVMSPASAAATLTVDTPTAKPSIYLTWLHSFDLGDDGANAIASTPTDPPTSKPNTFLTWLFNIFGADGDAETIVPTPTDSSGPIFSTPSSSFSSLLFGNDDPEPTTSVTIELLVSVEEHSTEMENVHEALEGYKEMQFQMKSFYTQAASILNRYEKTQLAFRKFVKDLIEALEQVADKTCSPASETMSEDDLDFAKFLEGLRDDGEASVIPSPEPETFLQDPLVDSLVLDRPKDDAKAALADLLNVAPESGDKMGLTAGLENLKEMGSSTESSCPASTTSSD